MKRILLLIVLFVGGGIIFSSIQNTSPPEPTVKAGEHESLLTKAPHVGAEYAKTSL
ncbi:hypothetical protein [Pseudalkalibacillus decolorationis]|uniref:hypothetical protein n=1 Tax=Pseudalkalibacillus decolorationis TaxID=163879 RepID=UPI002147A0BC|nr:hypothetical protein [Pseudalkalibacillus decolorationis]